MPPSPYPPYATPSELENKGLTPKELEREVLQHLREREITLNKIPYSIVIGPYQLNMEGVRDQLAVKRRELANAILGIILRNLRRKVDVVGSTITLYLASFLGSSEGRLTWWVLL